MKTILILALVIGIIYVLIKKGEMKEKETFRREKW